MAMKAALMIATLQMIVSRNTLLATGNPQILTNGSLQALKTGSLQMNAAQTLKQEKMDVNTSDTKRTVLAAENGAMMSVSKPAVNGLLRNKLSEAPERRLAQTGLIAQMELGL